LSKRQNFGLDRDGVVERAIEQDNGQAKIQKNDWEQKSAETCPQQGSQIRGLQFRAVRTSRDISFGLKWPEYKIIPKRKEKEN
jgi:hypothetical protein